MTTKILITIVGVLVLVAAGFFLVNILTPAKAPGGPPPSPAPLSQPPGLQAPSTETQYLLFQIFTYGPNPEGKTQPFSRANVKKNIDSILAAVSNNRGDGTRRQLGFSVGPLALDHTDEELRTTIRESFKIAEEKNVVVAFHIDDSMFWVNRKDLWQNPDNVEWSDWNKTVVSHRFVGWAPIPLAPQMCYTSPVIKSEIARIAKDVIGDEIEKGVTMLKARGKEDLFAGVIAGWETHLADNRAHGDDPVAKRFGIPATRLGYCALSHLGYSASHPPQDFDSALERVVHDWALWWAKNLHDAGIPKERIYTHIAWPIFSENDLRQIKAGFGENVNPLMFTHANVETAFNDYSRPGFSMYQNILNTISSALPAHGNPHWAMAEGTNTDTGLTWDAYLGGLFKAGATLVNIFAWQELADGPSPYGRATHSQDALKAYQKFLTGEKL